MPAAFRSPTVDLHLTKITAKVPSVFGADVPVFPWKDGDVRAPSNGPIASTMTDRLEKLVIQSYGFPVILRDVPALEFHDQWMPYINWDELQAVVVRALAHKPSPLTGNEVHFIRQYIDAGPSDFATLSGGTLDQVRVWEKRETNATGMRRDQEIALRTRILDAVPDTTRTQSVDSTPNTSTFQPCDAQPQLVLTFDQAGRPRHHFT